MELPIVVWDTEFTSWEECNSIGWNPENDEYKEIIQIGATKIGSSKQIEDKFSMYCKPRYNTQLSTYIKNLTGITQDDVSDARDLMTVWEEFESWRNGIDAYSFGNDISIVIYNLELYNENPRISLGDFQDARELLKDLNFPVDKYDVSGELHQHIEHDYEIDIHNSEDDALSIALVVIEYLD